MKPAVPIELNSLNDLARMLLSSAQEQASLFYFEENGETIFTSLVILPGYYEYNALPIRIYVRVSEKISGRFLRHNLTGKSDDEEVQIVDFFDEREASTGVIRYIPLIRLKKPPAFF